MKFSACGVEDTPNLEDAAGIPLTISEYDNLGEIVKSVHKCVPQTFSWKDLIDLMYKGKRPPQMTYLDEEGDVIHLGSESEWDEAMKIARQKDHLQLHVQPQSQDGEYKPFAQSPNVTSAIQGWSMKDTRRNVYRVSTEDESTSSDEEDMASFKEKATSDNTPPLWFTENNVKLMQYLDNNFSKIHRKLQKLDNNKGQSFSEGRPRKPNVTPSSDMSSAKQTKFWRGLDRYQKDRNKYPQGKPQAFEWIQPHAPGAEDRSKYLQAEPQIFESDRPYTPGAEDRIIYPQAKPQAIKFVPLYAPANRDDLCSNCGSEINGEIKCETDPARYLCATSKSALGTPPSLPVNCVNDENPSNQLITEENPRKPTCRKKLPKSKFSSGDLNNELGTERIPRIESWLQSNFSLDDSYTEEQNALQRLAPAGVREPSKAKMGSKDIALETEPLPRNEDLMLWPVKSTMGARFVCDETVPDGTKFLPCTVFIKKWCVENFGYKSWDSNTKLTFLWGTKGFTPSVMEVDVPHLAPRENGLVSVEYKSPSKPGVCESHWTFTHKGHAFGHQIWCSIEVYDPNSEEHGADMVQSVFSAETDEEQLRKSVQSLLNRERQFREWTIGKKHCFAREKVKISGRLSNVTSPLKAQEPENGESQNLIEDSLRDNESKRTDSVDQKTTDELPNAATIDVTSPAPTSPKSLDLPVIEPTHECNTPYVATELETHDVRADCIDRKTVDEPLDAATAIMTLPDNEISNESNHLCIDSELETCDVRADSLYQKEVNKLQNSMAADVTLPALIAQKSPDLSNSELSDESNVPYEVSEIEKSDTTQDTDNHSIISLSSSSSSDSEFVIVPMPDCFCLTGAPKPIINLPRRPIKSKGKKKSLSSLGGKFPGGVFCPDIIENKPGNTEHREFLKIKTDKLSKKFNKLKINEGGQEEIEWVLGLHELDVPRPSSETGEMPVNIVEFGSRLRDLGWRHSASDTNLRCPILVSAPDGDKGPHSFKGAATSTLDSSTTADSFAIPPLESRPLPDEENQHF